MYLFRQCTFLFSIICLLFLFQCEPAQAQTFRATLQNTADPWDYFEKSILLQKHPGKTIVMMRPPLVEISRDNDKGTITYKVSYTVDGKPTESIFETKTTIDGSTATMSATYKGSPELPLPLVSILSMGMASCAMTLRKVTTLCVGRRMAIMGGS